MNKKLITLAVSAAMAAPAAALAEATIYGKLNNSLDYVNVEQNAAVFGSGSIPYTGVPNGSLTQQDNIFITDQFDGDSPRVTRVSGGGLNSEVTFTESGTLVNGDGNEYSIQIGPGGGVAVFDSDGGEPIYTSATGVVPTVLPDGTVLLPKSQEYNGWDLNANARSNRIGVKGSEDLGGGLKAIYQVELGIYLTDQDGKIADGEKGYVKFRNSFIGLAGDWGTLLVGRHDTPEKIATAKLDLFSDTLADYNSTLGFADVRADNTVAYISPSFSGFQFAGAIIPSGGGTPLGYGGSNPTGINLYDRSTALDDVADGIADAWSIAGIYSNGPFYASLSYESLGASHWESTLEGQYFNSDLGLWENSYLGIPNYGGADSWNYWKVGLGILDWNGFTIDGIYEAHSNVLGAPDKADMDIWQVQAAYSFGNNTIKGMYGQNDLDSCVGLLYAATCSSAVAAETGVQVGDTAYLNNRDFSSWAIGFDHNFSNRTDRKSVV